MIVLIASYFLLAPAPKAEHREPRVSHRTYASTAVPAIGAYDGMFGPGTGSFFVLAGVALRAQQIVDATARAKSMNFATNLASLIVFALYGQLLITVGVVMMVGQVLGARLGAQTLMTINPAVLRYLVIGMCTVMLVSWGIKEM